MISHVLFLDFDGVLNCRRCLTSHGQIHTGHVRELNRIVKATGCKVCVSSTWRLIHTLPSLLYKLREKGYSGGLLGTTPDCGGTCRGDEISSWMASNGPVGRFVILDDDSDMANLKPRLVKTSFDTGLTTEKADEVIRMFR